MTRKELKNDGLYKIELEISNNDFIVSEKVESTEEFGELKTFKHFDDAEKYIENREKRKEAGIIKKKEPLSAIYKDHVEYKDVKITSISPSSYGSGFDVWIAFLEDKTRTKNTYYSDDYYKQIEENKKKILEMQELRKKADKIEESLESYTKEEIKKYFKSDD